MRHNRNSQGADSPLRSRSVAAGDETPAAPKTVSWEVDEGNKDIEGNKDSTTPKERQGSFLGKLKALTSPSSQQSRAPPAATTSSALSEQDEPSHPLEPSEDVAAFADEDSDELADELPPPSRKQRNQRPRPNTAESAPSTPRMARLEQRFASFMRDQSGTNDNKASPSRPTGRLSRRSTASDSNDNAQAGVSEDEGRDRIRNAWRRGIEGARGLSYYSRGRADNESPDARRPGHLRRITGLGGAVDGAASGSAFGTRDKPERSTTTSAQKWRQVKAGLKLLGQRRRDERTRVDHQKSAQLMAELLAGSPAALFLASMFQRDENNHKKIPVLLEQIKIRISDSQIRKESNGDRHLVFHIDLEYGNGPARMKWSISRSLKDFVNLHARYQASATADKVRHLRSEHRTKARQPRFPRSAFPYARGIRGLFENLQEEEEDDEALTNTAAAALDMPLASPMTPGQGSTPLVPGGAFQPTTPGFHDSTDEASPRHRRRRSGVLSPRPIRRSSTADFGPLPTDPEQLTDRQRELYSRRQRRKLETYLQQMIRWLIFRPDSTRLCQFLEISALAIRLSVEGGYQGKQGLLQIASRRNKELRRVEPFATFERHHPRWFLVRHSYVVCVDGPESLNPYDVFLVDSDFTTEKRQKRIADRSTTNGDSSKAVDMPKSHGKHLLIRLYNAERKLKLFARNERLFLQFQESIKHMAEETIWSKKQRFGSFAPVRNNVWCRWLVDGRDHTWQISRAIENAKDFVYIHGWWVSPELYMRRPAAISQKWRLDRLLQRKAAEGVKIFVIVYRNIESAMPIDSEYTKWALLDLHPNICIQRSPNQFRQNQFFWAHHEKMVIVDNMMAFIGGIDLCFGRWDEPNHTLTDDKLTGFELDHVGPRDSEHCQVWPGKDYSNPRVQDFIALDRPYEEMYDRTKVPRMPWHDISMQVVGQPARDAARHFVQRWNYILRSRIPSRPTPVLLPPPEFDHEELANLGMTGTCQVQVLRSCGSWSIGTPNKTEHSIMNAYVHLIENSDHFVYIENQFFITSCTVEGTPILNKIGDALVNRIIRAYDNDEQWQACILIPLMPGFQNSVDSQDGTSIRLIMQCQFRSICRGEASIFGRLRARGIDPEDYIRFYALRQWGKIGPRKCLTTEMLYIHAKCMIVDDRTVIIGSANINERSMLGNRDSEVATIVTDTRMIPSYMAGEPYEVGEYAHTLRKRLMREHLGIDVDACYRAEQSARDQEEQEAEVDRLHRQEGLEQEDYFSPLKTATLQHPAVSRLTDNLNPTSSVNSGVSSVTRNRSTSSVDQTGPLDKKDRKGTLVEFQHDLDVDGYGQDNMKAIYETTDPQLLDSYVNARGQEVMLKKESPELHRGESATGSETITTHGNDGAEDDPAVQPPYPTERLDTDKLGLSPRSQLPQLPPLDDTDIGGPGLSRGNSMPDHVLSPLAHTLKRPKVTEDCMTDPVVDSFYRDIWHQVAENNTRLYRQVFRCMPDSDVIDWKMYEKYNEYNERFMQAQGLGTSKPRPSKDAPDKSGPPGSNGAEIVPVTSMAEAAAVGRVRSKSVLTGFVDKLRPGSKASADDARQQAANEKDEAAKALRNAAAPTPDSPNSEISSGPTAVPSPMNEQPPLDEEKEAQKQTDDHQAQQVQSKDHSPQQQARSKVNRAPETTATQSMPTSTTPVPGVQKSNSQKQRKRRGTTAKSSARSVPEEVLDKDEAEGLLKLVQGHLVTWPYNWLEKEERNGNWLYNIDQLAPLEIYD
ncbi:hypothetical protein BDY17DRAFT_247509 [Neohortaea acidophila]|uniref:Phospholipase D1 n=1 Tax=Neohortaea acidophila TaxID=245834 RepID=A0A6A6PZU6_9PEZI|nr:uncharacterized protein BDY17DRAFT_247509 [Neohortaea acidophila]KAF2485266.1 hypothetical protein BDY17DRAFT_247509 [Neohortaea acidophila]